MIFEENKKSDFLKQFLQNSRSKCDKKGKIVILVLKMIIRF